jgi:hypothetical protein
MQIGQHTSFSDIHTQFKSGALTPSGQAAKHLRFDGGNTLYLHSSLSISRSGAQAATERAQKWSDVAGIIKAVINNEHGFGYADRIFNKISQANPTINLNSGVRRSDLNLIEKTIRQDLAGTLHTARGSTPTAFNLKPQRDTTAHLSGQFTPEVQEMLRRGLEAGIVTDRNKVEAGFPTVSQVFWKDHVDRHNQLSLTSNGHTQQLVKGGEPDPRVGLRQFTGSDASALSLSHYLNQEVAHGLLVGDGTLLKNKDGDMVVLDADRRTNYSVTKTDDGHYLLDYQVSGPINALRGSGNALIADKDASSVSYSMQLKVSQEDLEAGNGRYEITKPPSYDLHFKPDFEAMQQVA